MSACPRLPREGGGGGPPCSGVVGGRIPIEVGIRVGVRGEPGPSKGFLMVAAM